MNKHWQTLNDEEKETMEVSIDPLIEGDEFSEWATYQYLDKYAWKDENGDPDEIWPDTAYRVVKNVLGTLGYTHEDIEFQKLVGYISQRKFIPGGRYLANAGKETHQVNNCFSGDTRIITKHGVLSLAEAHAYLDPHVIVRNRFGQWEHAHVGHFGQQEIYRVVFSNGDVIETTKDHRWWQSDGTRVVTSDLERVPFGVADEMPDICAEGVRHGIIFGDGTLSRTGNHSYWEVVNPEKDQALVTWFDDEEREVVVGGGARLSFRTIRQTKRGTKVALQPAHYKELPTLCDPEYARGFIAGLIATDGCVSPTGSVTIHQEGLSKARYIAELAVLAGCVVNSVRIVSATSPFTGEPRELAQVSIKPFSAPIILPSHQDKLNPNQRHRMMELGVESIEATGRIEDVYCVVAPDSESFTLANGLITSNCFLYRCADSISGDDGWADLVSKAIRALSSGGGIGVVYSDVRPNGSPVVRTGNTATGPLSPACMVNEVARHVMAGSRRSAIWGGLHWDHQDIMDWITAKDWSEEQKAAKAKDYNSPAPLDMTNISVILDSEFFFAYHNDQHPKHDLAHEVYWTAVQHMLAHGEPGFSVDIGLNARENLRNACCEITSEDDSDVCNLGSINLARITDKEELAEVVNLATLFLLAGTAYSDVPHEEVRETREKNRRLGLGLMGVHEWLLINGYDYSVTPALREWLEIYARSTEYAWHWADTHGLSRPVKTRAIAPNGTIGIMAETTTSAEPVFCVAYKRRFLDNAKTWKYQYVIDPTVHRLKQEFGIDPDTIEDAYTLALNPEKRIKFQADLQEYVDHGISSTLNLPSPTTDPQDIQYFGDILIQYLPRLRGLTAYPDGARSGQPLTVASYHDAISKTGVSFDETDEKCVGGICGV